MLSHIPELDRAGVTGGDKQVVTFHEVQGVDRGLVGSNIGFLSILIFFDIEASNESIAVPEDHLILVLGVPAAPE